LSVVGYVAQAVIASIGGAGILYGVGRFLLSNVIGKRIDQYFNERLESVKAEYAASLATLTADLKQKADSRIEQEKSRYAEQLEQLRASLQQQATRELEAVRSRYAIEQETKKAELSVEAQETLELFKIRRTMYPSFVELMYRIRNKARESLEGDNLRQCMSELEELILQLIDKMYQFRVYLDHDGVHLRVHAFKNTSEAFLKTLRDDAKSPASAAELKLLFERLQQQESAASRSLQDLVSAHHAAPKEQPIA